MKKIKTRQFSKGDILVVDADKLSVKFLSDNLHKAGYAVRSAADGELALDDVKDKLPALILLDILLPGMDGYEVCRILKDFEDTKDIPIIFISGRTDPVDKVKAFGLGAVDYFSKPFEMEEVLARVATHLSMWDAKKEIEAKNLQLQQEIAERKHAEYTLRESENQFKTMFNEAPLGIALIDSLKGHIHEVNPMFAKIAGRTREEMSTIDWMSITHRDDVQEDLDNMSSLNAGKIDGFQMEIRYINPDGTVVWINMTIAPVEVEDKSHPRHLCMIEDITDRKQTERNQIILAEVLSILNGPKALADAISSIIAIFKREIGFDAIGIRLQNGDDFPYLSHNGFSDDFLISENTLVVRNQNGGICRDENGKALFEGTCRMILSGKIDPDDPNFTPGGSWWTNNSAALLNIQNTQDTRLNPRNRCVHAGFLSMALIPIRTNSEIVGLLQFNYRKKDCFTPGMIHFLEELSASIGVALMRKKFVDMLEKHALELELNEKRLDALLQLTHLADNSLENIASFVLDKSTELTNSKFGFIALSNDDESFLATYAWSKYVMDACSLDGESPKFSVKDGGCGPRHSFNEKLLLSMT